MKIPVQTSGTSFTLSKVPEALMDRDTGSQRQDGKGRPLFLVQLVAMTEEGAEVLLVRTPSPARGLSVGQPIKPVGLVATPWAMGERSGVTYVAEAIEGQVSR